MLEDIKKALGDITTHEYDFIIATYIRAGKEDLKQAGINPTIVEDESNALIYSALISFVLSMMDTYEYRELSANAYALQKDQLRHYTSYTRS